MTIITNTTERKQMAREISEHLGIPAIYPCTPTYAFQIGKLAVNRDASICAEDAAALDAIRPFLIEKGYIEAAEPTATDPEAHEQLKWEKPERNGDLQVPREKGFKKT